MSDDDQATLVWKRVYQGGHHDVWCNGEAHRRTYGGWCHVDNNEMPGAAFGDEFKCNCAYYRREKLNDAASEMFAALQAVDALWQQAALIFDDEAAFASPVGIVWKKVRDAIAKAEGRTP